MAGKGGSGSAGGDGRGDGDGVDDGGGGRFQATIIKELSSDASTSFNRLMDFDVP
jgi:hypothetical protein